MWPLIMDRVQCVDNIIMIVNTHCYTYNDTIVNHGSEMFMKTND